ncbi:hypothetical protein FSARC_14821 [Fusarium sarcochroum]|uniref:Uncharacterized protein n=1 Tax=Fusarium sarcochroum TaxID=1208366 RepID=A0A8H4SQK4_9HYPO|nr:hypothetical protein FSARC_14821 [Fusarium sarcochroum]
MASRKANATQRSSSSYGEDEEPIIPRRRRTRATRAPATPPGTNVQPATDPDAELELEEGSESQPESEPEPAPAPNPAPRGRGRPPGSKNKKGTKKSRREARKAAPTPEAGTRTPPAKRRKKLEEKELMKELHKRLNDEFPIVDDLEDIIGTKHPPFGESWNEADENALQYINSPAEEAFAEMLVGITAKRYQYYSKLTCCWKICIRIFRCSPFSLLSPLRGLVYLPVSKPEEEEESPAVWNQTFCDEMSHIITHGIWAGEAASLQAALQYAVICRTEDRRRWVMPPLDLDGGPLVRLNAALQDSLGPLPLSVHQMHRDARRNGPSVMIRCPLSNLFMQIAETAERKQESKSASRWSDPRKYSADGFPVYGVTIVDLKTVRNAIDSLQSEGSRLYNSTDVCYQEFLKVRSTNTDMPDVMHLAEFHRRAWLHEKRRMRRAKGLNGHQQGIEVNLHSSNRRDSFQSMMDIDEEEEQAEQEPDLYGYSGDEGHGITADLEAVNQSEPDNAQYQQEAISSGDGGFNPGVSISPRESPREPLPRDSLPRDSLPRESPRESLPRDSAPRRPLPRNSDGSLALIDSTTLGLLPPRSPTPLPIKRPREMPVSRRPDVSSPYLPTGPRPTPVSAETGNQGQDSGGVVPHPEAMSSETGNQGQGSGRVVPPFCPVRHGVGQAYEAQAFWPSVEYEMGRESRLEEEMKVAVRIRVFK